MKLKQLLPVKIILLFLAITVNCNLLAQTSADSLRQSQTYYNLGVQYKDGSGVKMDYARAYDYFNQAAVLGDAQSIYSMAYMKFKGLGCTQDYSEAAKLFAQGAWQCRDNSMYFYGLCWRNGYGVNKNQDSAKYWLMKADSLGYGQATLELQMTAPENSRDSAAQALLAQINNSAIVQDTGGLNKYHKIQPHLPSAEIIAGNYKGYLLQYDWSGQHIIYTKLLQLTIENKGGKLHGSWIEQNADSTNNTSLKPDTAKIEAKIEADSLLFSSGKYAHTDHYSISVPMQYQFQNAKLNVVESGDSIFLAGNLEQYSPQRREPAKPIFIILSRPGLKELTDHTGLMAYPNPFKSVLTAHFNLSKAEDVDIQLYTLNGTKVYDNPAGTLQNGYYSISLRTAAIANGVYLLKFIHGNNFKTIKVIKE